METPKPLLKNLGAKLRQMMAEDWRGEDERNTLGMAGYWLEMLGQSHGSKDELVPLLRELFSELPHPALLEAADRLEILQHNDQGMGRRGAAPTSSGS